MELEEYRQAVEARATPAGVVPAATASASAVVNTKITAKKATPTIAKNNSKSIKGALFIKKKKREHESNSSDEEEEEKDTKKPKTTPTKDTKTPAAAVPAAKGSLSLLSASYGDMSSSSDSDSE